MAKIESNRIPFERLVGRDDNVYEVTSAAIRRAEQLTDTKSEELKKHKIKIVSEALKEILDEDVLFRYKD